MRYLLLLTVVVTIGFTTFVSVPSFGFPLNGLSQGAISDLYPNTITPASYAFSIWSLIYLTWGILALAVALGYVRLSQRFTQVFSGAIVLSALWLVPFHYLYQWAALLIMVGILLLCLLSLHLSRSESRWAKYTSELYLGWITVATTANVAIVAISTPILAQIGILSANAWAVLGLTIATVVHTFVAIRYSVYIPGLVLIWALIANMVAHSESVQRIGVVLCIVWMVGILGYVYYTRDQKRKKY